MQIDIQWEVKEQTSLDYEKIIQDIVEESLDYVSCPYDVSLSVSFIESEEMRELNLSQRGIDYATDVLSFPLLSLDPPGSFPESLEEEWGNFDPETGELMLGDIVLSAEHIIQQAKEYGHSRERELAFLVVHSMLHLMGYDHMEDEERIAMEERQRQIMR